MAGFRAIDQAALADRVIPKKYKELMAIAVAVTHRDLPEPEMGSGE
jgi:alkylhydroperoxidase/carboxymuconolactone decarboxylase family protein YurZ